MMTGYIKGKKRRAETREIKTTVYNILRNTEAIGEKTMHYDLLLQRVGEHLEELMLLYEHEKIVEVVHEMIMEDMLYRTTTETGYYIGLVI